MNGLITETFSLRATRLSRPALEEAVARRAKGLDLDFRIQDTERSWLRRDFTITVWGSPGVVSEFGEWLVSLREGAGDQGP